MKLVGQDTNHPETTARTSIQTALQRAARTLQDTSQSPRLDAELLLMHTLQVPRTHLHAWPERNLAAGELTRFESLVEQRRAGRPVAYLLSRQAFYGLALTVTPDTLIPRPETELLVDFALDRLQGIDSPTVADLGTGSGAVALAIASERPDASVDAVENCPRAGKVARANAGGLALENINVLTGNWFEPLAGRRYHAVVANPPYVADAEATLTSPETAHEPRQALYAANEGLAALRTITAGAGTHLLAGGWLAVEHGFRQGPAVRALLAAAGFEAIDTRPDLAGRERMSFGRWPGQTAHS